MVLILYCISWAWPQAPEFVLTVTQIKENICVFLQVSHVLRNAVHINPSLEIFSPLPTTQMSPSGIWIFIEFDVPYREGVDKRVKLTHSREFSS